MELSRRALPGLHGVRGVRQRASYEGDDPALDAVVPQGAESVTFTATEPGPAALPLSVPGRHNALNARAALAAIGLAGGTSEAPQRRSRASRACSAARSSRASVPAPLVYDDYAHHPTEVRATLAALRELQPERLIAVFQPHLYSRTKALASDFGAALAAADEVGVLDVYAAREEPVGPLEGVSGLAVARAAADHGEGKRVMWLERPRDGRARPGAPPSRGRPACDDRRRRHLQAGR